MTPAEVKQLVERLKRYEDLAELPSLHIHPETPGYTTGGVLLDTQQAASALLSLAQEREELREALDTTLIGGNHLANVLIGKLGGDFNKSYPPALDPSVALEKLGPTDTYDVWCCWAAIMRARAALKDT